jgi:hypothetical protein
MIGVLNVSIFKSIKNLFSGTNAEKERSDNGVKIKNNAFVKNIIVPRFNKGRIESIAANSYESWDEFFKTDKTNPKLIGFEKRSRRKFRHLYHSDEIIITEAAKNIEIVSKERRKVISFYLNSLGNLSALPLVKISGWWEQGKHMTDQVNYIVLDTMVILNGEFPLKKKCRLCLGKLPLYHIC